MIRGGLCAAFVLIFVGGCGPCDTILSPYCPAGQACWIDMETAIPRVSSVGECAAGAVVCGDGGEPVCVGTVPPTGEVCDGLDNDCDGQTDENAFMGDIPDCQGVFCGDCRPATVACQNGMPTCVAVFPPTAEVCDGRDNDCDCEVDNDLSPEFFYDGPDFTVGRGQCLPGVQYCSAGSLVEVPAVYPEPELCDGIDNDCDGFTDEPDFGAHRYYLILDVSGSMSSYSDAASEAFCDFARASPTGTLFAVAVVAGTDTPPYVELAQDFAEATVTCDTIHSVGFTAPMSGLEYMLEPFGLPLTWPGADTSAIVITDEELRVFGDSGVDAADVVTMCVVEAFSVFVYTHTQFADDWLGIVDVCGGDVRPLPATTGAFREDFVSLFSEQCEE